MDEIPEAIRVRESTERRQRSPLLLIVGGVFCLAAVGLLTIFLTSSSSKTRSKVEKPTEAVSTVEDNPSPPVAPTTPPVASSPSVASSTPKPEPENLLGHLPYKEIPTSELEPVTADGSILLHSKAAEKFRQMQAAAATEGVILTPVSGFRSVETQEQLFFEIKEERVQDATTRAEVSAPPGYSEHHTGYAIDIGDGKAPQAHAEPEFANTEAFRWLQKNAAKYSFELSFPPGNAQGVSYEPWHWRYVGDRHSLETFYKVRN